MTRGGRGGKGWLLLLAGGLLSCMTMSLVLVWCNIERTDTTYFINAELNTLRERRALRAKLEVERERLLSPYELRLKAEKLGLRPVVFLHYPPVYDNMECRGILDILVERGVKECYYGHVHGTQAARRAPVGEYRGVKMHLISADYVKFVPTLVR